MLVSTCPLEQARTCTAVGVIGSGGFGLLKKYQTPEGSLIAVKFQVRDAGYLTTE